MGAPQVTSRASVNDTSPCVANTASMNTETVAGMPKFGGLSLSLYVLIRSQDLRSYPRTTSSPYIFKKSSQHEETKRVGISPSLALSEGAEG